MTAPERVPGDLVHRLQDEQTPTDPCGPHCHQGAVLEALIDELKGMRHDGRERHRATMSELSLLKGSVSDLQVQFARLAVEQARTANLAGETASHQALTPQDAARMAPRDSVAPSGRVGVTRRTRGLLYALGVVLAGAGTTVVTRCVEAQSPTPVPAAQQTVDGP